MAVLLLLVEDFYQDVQTLRDIIVSLDFKDVFYGEEIIDFNQIDPEIEKIFTAILGMKYEVNQKSGVFRKPYPTIHFEDFDEKLKWVVVIALEDTEFILYKHTDTGAETVFGINISPDEFVKENCFNENKWEKMSRIRIASGSAIFFRPWMWHAFRGGLVQVFYLES